MLQEQSVLERVVKHQIGLRFSGPEDILVQLKQFLSPSKLKCYQQHIAAVDNHGAEDAAQYLSDLIKS